MFKHRDPRGATTPGATSEGIVREWDRRHGPHRDAWLVGEVVVVALMGVWWVLRAILRHPFVAVALAVVALSYWACGYWGIGVVGCATAVGLYVWRLLGPASFDVNVSLRARGHLRGWWIYGRRWTSAMTMTGLGAIYDGGRYVPLLRRVRSNDHLDRLTVQLLQGQHPDEFSDQADTLAHTFGMRGCRVRIAGPGLVHLDFMRRDPLAAIVPALPIPDVPNLDALPIGRREDGGIWTVRLRGAHLLIAGSTGAGKGSVEWSLVRTIAPLIRDRLVRLWVIDPKGGMELAIRGADVLYHRFACDDPEDQAVLLEEAVSVMRERTHRLRGETRLHVPTAEDPHDVVLIDEYAALTAYRPKGRDARELYGRIDQAANLLLSQGRAPGFSVVVALQDPRKEVLPNRDLFTTRIALRLVEAEGTDMILGPGARDRGAACERIPVGETGAGQGYVWSDGEAEPARVRAGYVTDDDITYLAEHYRPRRPGAIEVVEVPA